MRLAVHLNILCWHAHGYIGMNHRHGLRWPRVVCARPMGTSRRLNVTGESTVELTFPRPTWYTLDRNLITDADGRITLNLAPYLVPIVNDWERRPGAPP